MTLTSPRWNGRVSETFCWFPPESVCTGCSIDAVRMLRRFTRPSTVRRSRRRLRNPRAPSRRSTWIVALARTLRTGKSDSDARSPLSSTTPARSGPSGELESSSLPSQVAVPVARSAPASARRNCACPLPSAPAIPTISPLATSRSIGPNRSPRSPETARSTSRPASRSCRCGNASSSGRPIMSATRLSSDIEAASNVPWPTPSRRTLIRSAMPRTSGRRWLT